MTWPAVRFKDIGTSSARPASHEESDWVARHVLLSPRVLDWGLVGSRGQSWAVVTPNQRADAWGCKTQSAYLPTRGMARQCYARKMQSLQSLQSWRVGSAVVVPPRQPLSRYLSPSPCSRPQPGGSVSQSQVTRSSVHFFIFFFTHILDRKTPGIPIVEQRFCFDYLGRCGVRM
jgi:hypothetical protein